MDNNKWRYIDRTRQHNPSMFTGMGGEINSTKKIHKKVKTRKQKKQNKNTRKHYKKCKKIYLYK